MKQHSNGKAHAVKTKEPVTKQKPAGFSFRHIRLDTRLTLLILGIAVPLILLTSLAVSQSAEARLLRFTQEQLEQSNAALAAKAEVWLKYNVELLKQLASLDSIVSMDPDQQKSTLVKTANAFPDIFLIHTINPKGLDLARSDNQENGNNSDQDYFMRAMLGDEITAQARKTGSTNQVSLTIGTPIRDASGRPVGVVALDSDLSVIAQNLVTGENSQRTGRVTFVVDTMNTVIAHPDVEIANRLADYSGHPAVVALRAGKKGQYEYSDANRQKWFAHLTVLSNGWGIITEQPARLALSSFSTLRAMAWMVSALVTVLLVVLVYLVMRRSIAPISELASRAAAIAGGDLYQTLPVQHQDEIGELSASFNRLTEQLRGLVGSLDQRVEERTRAIELSSEVSRRLVTILDPDELARKVVEQLKSAFNYDHVQLYLFDERFETLALVAATGETGRVLLARDHKIARGRGMVGRAANNNLPVLVENTTLDPSWLPNNLLPETKAEVAVPIAVGEQVLGVLDVQQNWVGGLRQTDMDLIQSLANQVAVAMQNARAHVSLQQQARREALVAAVNQKIQRTTTVEEALQVAVSELGQALAARSVRIELQSSQAPDRTSN